MGVVTSLAGAQLRHRPGRWSLLALGVALALALPVLASGTGATVAADTLRRTVGTLDPGSRGILVTDNRSIYDRGPTPALDAVVAKQLGRLSSGTVRKEMVFRELTTGGSTFYLAGVDHLADGVKVVSGRLPQSCTPTRCEVVAVDGGGVGGTGETDLAALTRAASGLGVVVVGRAVRTDPLIVSGSFDTRGIPLLLGDGPDRMALLSSLDLFSRTYGWVVPLDVDRVLALGVPGYVRRSTAALNTISAQSLGISTYPPDDALATADQRAALSGRRFGLLGGSTAVLLLGFALVAAVGLRREQALLVSVVRRRGARWPTVTRMTTYEAAAACLLGAVAGVAAGALGCAWLAHRAALPAGRTVSAALSGSGGGVVLLTVLAVALTVGVLLWPDTESKSAWRAVDLVALACLGTAVLAASRGAVATGALRARNDPLLVALPLLAAVTTGLVAARLWIPLARLAERVLPRRSIAGRIALLGAVRRPLRAVATTAFLAAAVASVVFAGAYRSTLLQGSADQAAYAVPLDASLRTGVDLSTPLAVTNPGTLEAIAPGISAFDLVRSTGVVRTGNGDSAGVPILGLDPEALTHVNRWSRTTGSGSGPGSYAKALAATPLAGTAPTLPAGTRTVTVQADGALKNVQLLLWVSSADGREGAATLSGSGGTLTGQLPDLGPGPLRAVGLGVREDPTYASRHQHTIGEGNTDVADLAGTFHLGTLSADGTPVPWSWNGWGSGLATATTTDAGLDLSYRLGGALIVVQPGYRDPATEAPLPVVVDPATARGATAGILTLSLGQTTIKTKVVGVLPRFPTVVGRFVLADRPALTRLLDGEQPGTGAVGELWVSAADGHARSTLESALGKAPYDRLKVGLREPYARQLSSDPVARGSRHLLGLAAALALLVAAASVVLLVSGDRRDDAGELNAWESDGVRPATLRRVLFVRALSVIAVAVPVGLVGGIVLASVGADLVAVDASGLAPRPPLQVHIGFLWTTTTLLLGLALALGLAAGVAASALRERLPVRPEVELR